jgi:hypothetical protein
MSAPFAVWAAVVGTAWTVFGAVMVIRYLAKLERKEIATRIAGEGGKVIWVKRLDATPSPTLFGSTSGRVTTYDVLVERGGVRRIEVWRNGVGGVARDH